MRDPVFPIAKALGNVSSVVQVVMCAVSQQHVVLDSYARGPGTKLCPRIEVPQKLGGNIVALLSQLAPVRPQTEVVTTGEMLKLQKEYETIHQKESFIDLNWPEMQAIQAGHLLSRNSNTSRDWPGM